MARRLVLLLCLAALLAPVAAAPAYPPVTCGRVTVGGAAFVVRSHGPSCAKALSWARGYIAKRRTPAGYHCRAYGADVPAVCVRTGHKNTYFNATRA